MPWFHAVKRRCVTRVEVVEQGVINVQSWRSQQLAAIRGIAASENLVAVLPTGKGKSLCYPVGTMMLNGFTVVVASSLGREDPTVHGTSQHSC